MEKKLTDIATLIGAEIVGERDVAITGVAGIKEARSGDCTFLHNEKYLALAKETKASAIIASMRCETLATILKVKNPSWAFSKVVALFYPPRKNCFSGVHPSAVVGNNVKLGKDVNIGPFAVIEDNVTIGNGTTVFAGTSIGYDTVIGEACTVDAHVSIREKTKIGNRVVIHCGTVIGADGYGYDTVDGIHHKIPQVGCVVIEDDVEIGANVTIDRARFDKTIIGQGTKIDNLVHIAHNVTIGKHCLIVAQVGISGSTVIGDHVTLAGQAGLAGHLTVGNNVIVGAQAGVTKSISDGEFVSGYPAQPHKQAIKINAHVQRLPQLHENVKTLQRRLDQLEKKPISLKRKKGKQHGKSKNH